jgi:tetratricopeptide (TPR) repeat protein
MMRRIGVAIFLITALGGVFSFRGIAGGGGNDAPPPAVPISAAAAELSVLEQTVRDRPDDASALTRLASLYVQRSRETGDPSFDVLAGDAADRALAVETDNVQAIVIRGIVALAQHDFERALLIGERARTLAPDVNAVYGLLTDAYVELGRYEEALATAQEMVDRRPDFASYSRVSYLRELYGDLDGAVEAMEFAAAAGAASASDEAWAFVQIGHLQLTRGDTSAADAAYRRAAAVLPGDAMTDAGLARSAFSVGDPALAEALLRAAVANRPLAEYATLLGDLLWSQGREREAEEQYALVRATQELATAQGVDTELELALFEADQGMDPEQTYIRAHAAYVRRPSIYAADVLAWAAFKSGRLDEARTRSDEALRLGTRDARLSYHAGVIASAAGDRDAALRHLMDAAAMQAAQSPKYAVAASQALDDLTSAVLVR